MGKLLKKKYNKVLELVDEQGKILMQNIDDGDLQQLIDELKTEGYICSISASTDTLDCEKKQLEGTIIFDN